MSLNASSCIVAPKVYAKIIQLCRLTMIYALVIWFHASMVHYIPPGMMDIVISSDSKHCQDNWLSNLLYVSTLWNRDDMVLLRSICKLLENRIQSSFNFSVWVSLGTCQ